MSKPCPAPGLTAARKNGTKWHWEAAFSNGFRARSRCREVIQSMVSECFTTFDDVHATPACSAISGDSVPFQCHFSCARRFLIPCPAWEPGDHPWLRGPESQARAPSDRASAFRSAGAGSRSQIGRSVAFPATAGGQTKDSDEDEDDEEDEEPESDTDSIRWLASELGVRPASRQPIGRSHRRARCRGHAAIARR